MSELHITMEAGSSASHDSLNGRTRWISIPCASRRTRSARSASNGWFAVDEGDIFGGIVRGEGKASVGV